MSMEKLAVGLDLEDLSPRQLRKILNGVVRSQLPYSKKTKEEQEKDTKEADEESESLARLHKEKTGDSKPPKVLASDFRSKPEDDDEDEDEDETPTKKKA